LWVQLYPHAPTLDPPLFSGLGVSTQWPLQVKFTLGDRVRDRNGPEPVNRVLMKGDDAYLF
jgi:hypothetical protein